MTGLQAHEVAPSRLITLVWSASAEKWDSRHRQADTLVLFLFSHIHEREYKPSSRKILEVVKAGWAASIVHSGSIQFNPVPAINALGNKFFDTTSRFWPCYCKNSTRMRREKFVSFFYYFCLEVSTLLPIWKKNIQGTNYICLNSNNMSSWWFDFYLQHIKR